MSRELRSLFILGILALFAPTAWAIDLGSPAPEVQIATWVKNGPVDLSKGKGKNIFVVEFWATWCGPCVQSIPHLTELQNKYRDQGVVIVGVTDETPAVVKPFVEKMGDKMGYAVGIDKRETTHRNYMAAFNIDGIPYAFVIGKDGAIAWHGHPASGLDRVLERIVQGKYDIKLAKQEAAAGKLLEQYAETLEALGGSVDKSEQAKLQAKAKKIGESILEQAAQVPDVLNELASMIVLAGGLEHRDLDLAARATETAYKAGEKTAADKGRKFMLDYYRTLRGIASGAAPDEKTKHTLQELGTGIIESAEAQQLNEFAWTVLMTPGLEPRDLALALKAADKARVVTQDKDAAVLDTYARALLMNGQRDKAIEYGRKAIEINEDARLEPFLKKSLQEYEKAPAANATR